MLVATSGPVEAGRARFARRSLRYGCGNETVTSSQSRRSWLRSWARAALRSSRRGSSWQRSCCTHSNQVCSCSAGRPAGGVFDDTVGTDGAARSLMIIGPLHAPTPRRSRRGSLSSLAVRSSTGPPRARSTSTLVGRRRRRSGLRNRLGEATPFDRRAVQQFREGIALFDHSPERSHRLVAGAAWRHRYLADRSTGRPRRAERGGDIRHEHTRAMPCTVQRSPTSVDTTVCEIARAPTGRLMEKGALIGLGMCVGGVLLSATLHGINIAFLFTETAALAIVWAGSLGATIAAFPFEVTRNVPKYLKKATRPDEVRSATGTIRQVVVLTNRARADGMLALEEAAKDISDPFFRKGIELAVDGTDPDALKQTLNAEITAMKERHKLGAGWLTQAGVFSPTFGIIGAVFGLMATMAHLAHPDQVGTGIAGAFVATFWGVFLANGVWLPLANKLKQLSAREVAHKQLIVEGIMAIQAGVSPRVIEELLKSRVPPSERENRAPDAASGEGRSPKIAAA